MKPNRSFPRWRVLALSVAIALPAEIARAQSFNVDIGANVAFPVPTPPYGGALNQPGFWNDVDATAAATPLRNLMNLTTAVFLARVGGMGNFEFDHPGTAFDVENLLDDLQNVGGPGAMTTWTYHNLANGLYDVLTYAWGPDNAAFVSNVTPGCSSDGPQLVGGLWPGAHVRGVTYALHRVNVTSGDLAIQVSTAAGAGSVNGMQIRLLPPEGVPGCFGDGFGEACPCANFGAIGRGCENSAGTGGGLLQGFGVADVSNDTFALACSHLPDTAPVLYFQGTSALDPDADGLFGVQFGDGLRCVGGSVIRLGLKTSACGNSSYPGLGEDSISMKGALPVFGGTRFYQAWYRNAAAFCPPSTFNLTNGLQVTWVP